MFLNLNICIYKIAVKKKTGNNFYLVLKSTDHKNDAVITIVHKITGFFKCSSYFDVISIIISDRIQLTTTISTIYS